MSISARVLVADSLIAMGMLPHASVDAVVTDPPYGLGFMGKAWDHGVPGVPFWEAALRVARPGAHLVAFGGTRTYHRLTVAIEDAGWEIRDCLSWLYGSGFPKSLDVSKAMDKARRRDFVLAAVRLGVPLPDRSVDDWTKEDHAPGDKWWSTFKASLPPETWRGIEREVLQVRSGPVPGNHGGSGRYGHGEDRSITAPATDLARQWEGWGTALKPAWEPIILARKPLVGTVASNVTAHGTGALDIDGCRIEVTDPAYAKNCSGNRGHADNRSRDLAFGMGCGKASDGGRWPANVVLDEDAAAMLDAQTGDLSSGFMAAGTEREGIGYRGGLGARVRHDTHGDTGGASRFFYTAKASASEREAGLQRFAAIRRTDGRDVDIENPRLRTSARKNHHPTVKPLALMQWLCRLVTPPGGLILDPFTGSGSTGCAAVAEGFGFLGIELHEEYAAIAGARIAHHESLIVPDLFSDGAA